MTTQAKAPLETNPAEIRKVFLMLSLFITIATLLAGAYMTYLNYQFLQHSQLAEATLSDIEEDGSTDQIAYRPIFKFTTPDGKTHTVASKTIFTKFDFPIGSKTPILYNSQNPQDLRIESHFSLFNISGFLFFTAGIFLITFLTLYLNKKPSHP